MESSLPFRGIVTVLNTPFSVDDAVDFAALAAHGAEAVAAGVSGVIAPALASEVYALSAAEREGMVKALRGVTSERVPLIGGAAADSRDERLAWAGRLPELGCDGVLYTPPPMAFEDLAAELREAGERCGGFLILQDWDPSGPGLAVDDIVRLWESVPNLKGVKVETIPAGPKYSAILEATGGALHVSGGWAAAQMIEGLERGIHAFMPTAMHRIYVEVHRRFAAGDGAGARELFYRVAPVLAFTNQHLDISIHFFKRLLHAKGIYPTARVRGAKRSFDTVHARLAEEHIATVLALEEELRF